MEILSNDMDIIFGKLAHTMVYYGDFTGTTTELRNVLFTLTDPENCLCRNLSLSYLLGEHVWYLTGRNDVDFISRFGSLWGRISDDGVTSNSAYGYIIREKYGFDQLQKVIELLKADPTSRRAVININVPNEQVGETKDEPCTIALQFVIRGSKLCCSAMMRSNDIWYGTPYDVAYFTTLQKIVAQALGCKVGAYSHFAVSLHVYSKDYKKLVSLKPMAPKVRFDALKCKKLAQPMADLIMSIPKEQAKSEIERYAFVNGILEVVS